MSCMCTNLIGELCLLSQQFVAALLLLLLQGESPLCCILCSTRSNKHAQSRVLQHLSSH